jgi:hypothetical protein
MSNHDLVGGRCCKCGLMSRYASRQPECPGLSRDSPLRPTLNLGRSSLAAPHVTPLTGVGLVDDRSKLDETLGPDGKQKTYLVLSEAERAKGYVRPVRTKYVHVGRPGPRFPLRDLTDDDRKSYGPEFVKYEEYPESERPLCGRGWTQEMLDKVGKGCGAVTTMSLPLAETYAAQPGYYGGTFCATCRTHFPVGADGEFVWEDGSRVGT